MIDSFEIYLPLDASASVREKACNLSQQVGWPICDQISWPHLASSDSSKQTLDEAECAFFEYLDDKLLLRLELNGAPQQLSFDLGEGEAGLRAVRASKSNEILARAIGCKPHYRPDVIDATAGMGRDSLIMASLGCQVNMQERNPAIFQLLSNALTRFQLKDSVSGDQTKSGIAERLSLHQLDGGKGQFATDAAAVIYLDPMFPQRKKSALVKKEMRLFKRLAGDDLDSDQLLLNALASASKRVVVKRPKGAPFLADKSPSHQVVSKNFRYDVYLV